MLIKPVADLFFAPDFSLSQSVIHHLRWEDLANLVEKRQRQYLQRAYHLASRLHRGQKRLSGDSWESHLLFVAWFLARLHFNQETLAAALLHDSLETGKITPAELYRFFGQEVGQLVEGVTEIRGHTRGNLDIKSPLMLENMRRLILASLADIRVLIIRLLEKYHGALTIDQIPLADRQRQAEKLKRLYAPLAEYINFYYLKREMEDIAFKVQQPKQYQFFQAFLRKRHLLYDRQLYRLEAFLRQKLREEKIAYHTIYGRRKGIYSSYLKLKRYYQTGKIKDFHPRYLYDWFGLTIITENIPDCYRVLAVLINNFPVIVEELDDYIQRPKPSGYRAIHLPVKIRSFPLEIQIKTLAMHYYNEFGPASHVLYKMKEKLGKVPADYRWIAKLSNWRRGHFHLSVFDKYIYVFTPKREVIQLPKGAAPLDFAAKIHSELLNYYRGALVNEKPVKLKEELKNGDLVTILKRKRPQPPRPDWLFLVRSKETKRKIEALLKKSLNAINN